jgi:tetratricopeptide (TPR) repeat protein
MRRPVLLSALIAVAASSLPATTLLASREEHQTKVDRGGAASVSSSQKASASPGVQNLRPDYFALLDMYQKGDADRAVAACALMRKRDLPDNVLLRQLSNARLRAVVLLHIEASLNGASTDTHAAVVRLALERTRESDPEFARSALILFVSGLVLTGSPVPSDLLGLPNKKMHPEILLLNGSLLEKKAAEKLARQPNSRDVLGELQSQSQLNGEPLGAGSPRDTAAGMLRYAEWHYRAALEGDPRLVEARVRLGRVLQIEQRWADARREFEQAEGEATEPFLKYLAALFRGQVEEREKRYDAAIQAYHAALGRYPDAQAASLGLGHAFEMKGEFDAGWAAVRKMLMRGNQEPQPDPWTVYSLAQYWQAERRIAELRKTVQR